MATLKNIFFRHFHCKNCESKKIPTRGEAGITLHAIHFERTYNGLAYISVSCLHCEAQKVSPSSLTYSIVKSRHYELPLISWNALIDFKEDCDGYQDSA